ncbi:hypothetical protein ES703_25426 [subsurface metagenome]
MDTHNNTDLAFPKSKTISTTYYIIIVKTPDKFFGGI